MLAVSIFRRNLLKYPINVISNCRRSLLTKKKSNWGDEFLGKEDFSNFENIQNSKLTPKGFEIIYASPLLKYLKISYTIIPLFWVGLCYDAYLFIKDENYIKKVSERIKNFSAREKVIHLILFGILNLVLQLASSRVIVAIFYKENEFRTLLYGFLGPLTKTYVSHGYQVMEPTKYVGIYTLKGKHVLLLSSGFRNIKDFFSIVKEVPV